MARRLLVSASLVALATFLIIPVSAHADNLLGIIVTGPTSVTVVEGSTGSVSYMISNPTGTGMFNPPIDINLGGAQLSAPGSFQGDSSDQMLPGSFHVTGGDCGTVLKAGASCNEIATFTTLNNIPDTDTPDFGFAVSLVAIGYSYNCTTLLGVPSCTNDDILGALAVEVDDPGFTSAVPEPSSILLVSTGTLAWIAKSRRRFIKGNR